MNEAKKKLVVIFPGMGYGIERNLLKYSKQKALERGFEVLALSYGDLPKANKDRKDLMKEAFDKAYARACEQVCDVDFNEYSDLVFISKSIGTVVASVYALEHGLTANHVYLTPVTETFKYVKPSSGIMFHGLADPWCDSDYCIKACKDQSIKLFTYEGANHSIECGDFDRDMDCLRSVINNIDDYLALI